ncbi:MAG TPA: asparagine synthase (glutamine-hydrolyzing), partial [Candidatus Omnitrophota bacterium]|nr:asparagine synthase (glutamine-hydrolyzing) [Candidatus Omnitrophota bacterium]
MCSEMKHRGPDDEGIYLNTPGRGPSAALGHRRLSIIDLSSCAKQPMSNEDGSVWLVLNGEIYNYKELRPGLESRGHKFRSHSDTETLLHLYEEHGVECVEKLRGMFAFAIWDDNKKALFAARDRVGKKPFLYRYKDGRFVFASEFAALLRNGEIARKVSDDAIYYYMSLGYVPAPMSALEGVNKLPPAHYLTLSESGIKVERYWELDYSKKINISEEDAAAEVKRLAEEAVKIRLFSDVPLGAFLSGGVDSSCVVAMMSALSAGKVRTFTIGFEEKDYSELEYARKISGLFGTEHREFIVKPNALDIVGMLAERYGEPYADSSCIPTYYVSKETRAFVTVALNGDGGDESFAGYERYQAMSAAEKIRGLGLGAAARTAAGVLPDSTDPKDLARRARRFLTNAGLPAAERYLRWVGIAGDVKPEWLYSGDYLGRIDTGGPLGMLKPYTEDKSCPDMLDRLLKADVNTSLPNDLLVKVDIAGMAASLEGRSPFLDHKLMEFAASLPASYKIRGGVKKYILKKAFSGTIPGDILSRRKMGFGVPVSAWFRGELKGMLAETLLSKAALSRGYFRQEAVRAMVESHTSGRKDYSFQLWAMLMLELWHKRFIDR